MGPVLADPRLVDFENRTKDRKENICGSTYDCPG